MPARSPAACLLGLVLLLTASVAIAQGPPPEPQLWSAVSAMDALAAARTCSADPTCTSFGTPDGVVQSPSTGQPLLSVHCKGAMDVTPIHDWAAAHPEVLVDEKLVHVFDMTGFEVDLAMDLLDGPAWEGLRGALDIVSEGAFVSLHGVPVQQDGVQGALAAAPGQVAACAGDMTCLQDLRAGLRWLDAELGFAGLQIEVAHDGEPGVHDGIEGDLEGLSWAEPPWVFAVEHTTGGDPITRAVGRLAVSELEGLQAFFDSRPWGAAARTRPMTWDELSMVRLTMEVAEAAADLVACEGDTGCHWAVGQEHQVVVSPAGRIGVTLEGQSPDIEGLNGFEYPGWTVAPEDYVASGVGGLVSWGSLRELGLDLWGLDEPLAVKLAYDPDLLAASLDHWLDLWDESDSPFSWGGGDIPPIEGTLAQSFTWMLDYAEDPALCPANNHASFVGPWPSPRWPQSLEPPPPGTGHLVQSVLPSGVFWFDYLHCRELIQNVPTTLESDPGLRMCGDLEMGLIDEQSPYPDLYELAAGTPLNSPLGVNNGGLGGGSPEHFWKFVPDEIMVPRSVSPSAAGSPPEVKLHEFEHWRSRLRSDSDLQDDLRLQLTGFAYVEGFDLKLGYSARAMPPDPTDVDFVETVTVPASSWRFEAEFFVHDWSLADLRIDPTEIPGWEIELGHPTVTSDGLAGGLESGDLVNHALLALELMVAETLEDRLAIQEPALAPFFEDYVIEMNPVLLASEPNTWLIADDGWASDGSRQLLAVDQVETDQAWQDHVSSYSCSNSFTSNHRRGLAAIAEAEVPFSVLDSVPEGTVVAEPPGFREVVLDDALAQVVADTLEVGDVSSGVSLDLWGPRDDDNAGQRNAVLEENHLPYLLEDFLGGYLDWVFAPDISAFGCDELVVQMTDACLLQYTPDECNGRGNVDEFDMAEAVAAQCDLAPTWDVDQAITVPSRPPTIEEIWIEDTITALEDLSLEGSDAVIGLLQELALSPSEELRQEIADQLAEIQSEADPVQAVIIDAMLTGLWALDLDQLGLDIEAVDSALHLCGSVQAIDVAVTVSPGSEMDEACGDLDPHFATDLGASELEFHAGQCAVALVALDAEFNLAVYDTDVHDSVVTAPGGGCPAIGGNPRSAMRLGPGDEPNPVWDPAVGSGAVPGVFSVDLQAEVRFNLGVTMNWAVPLAREGTWKEAGNPDSFLVGWDSMDDWYLPMTRQFSPNWLNPPWNATLDPGEAAATDLTVTFTPEAYDAEEDDGGVSVVGGSGHVDVVRGPWPWYCPMFPGGHFCALLLTALAANGDVPTGDEELLLGGQLDQFDISGQLPAPVQFAMPNTAPTLLDDEAVLPIPPWGDPLPALVDDEGLSELWIQQFAAPIGLVPPDPDADELDETPDYSLFIAMFPTTDPYRRSMIDDLSWTNTDPPANAVVWTIQDMAFGLRLDEAGWPTREAVWRTILDQECAALDVDSHPERTIDCSEDVLVDLVGPNWAEGEAGAIWLFRPPSGFSLDSGAAWKPGRLPAPGP